MESTVLLPEIQEQPHIIADLISSEKDNVSRITESIRGKFDYVVIAARGTSDNAARYAQYLFGAHNKLQIALATPSLFSIYGTPPSLHHALAIGISQSGKSPDIVSVLLEARRQGRPTLAITNDSESPLAQTADFIIPLHAGKEMAVAATKTYTSSLASLALLSCMLEENSLRLAELEKMPNAIQETLDRLLPIILRAERYRYMQQCAVLGRGFNYATAFEIALKIKELTRVVAEPYSSADYRHGPIATATPGFPVIVVSPRSVVSQDLEELLDDLKKRRAERILISDDSSLLEKSDFPLPISEGVPEWLSPLVCVLPGQLLGMRMAVEKGLNPDQPEGLRKVTETL